MSADERPGMPGPAAAIGTAAHPAVRLIAAAVLLVIGGWALVRWPDEMRGAGTPLQQLTALGVLGYGLSGVTAGAGVLAGRPWARGWAWMWAAAFTLTGGLAPVAFGGTSWGAGVAAGLATALVAGAVLWMVRRAVRTTRGGRAGDGSATSPEPAAESDAASPDTSSDLR